ncbi:MAG: 3-oxoadipate enol-lactonase [Pseudomonadota bacterium]|nr:3-oxoadipate enol-lactonase [Pseudomonadota bacterium]
MHFVTVNDIAIHAGLTAGARPGSQTLVFVNSLGTDFRIWDAVVATLGGRFTTLRYDKRGHGLSDVGATPYRMDDHIADLAALMDRFELRRAVIVGLSVGGMIAQGLARSRPDLVEALVLSNTAHKIGDRATWDQRIDTVERDGIGAICEGVMEKWFTPDFRREDNPAFRGHRNMLLRASGEGYMATCNAIANTDFTKEAPLIDVPTLCIAGEEDGSTPPDLVRSLADLIPNARFALIEAAGHIPNVERPEAYANEIERFLQECSGR